jgi:hypothetical protein
MYEEHAVSSRPSNQASSHSNPNRSGLQVNPNHGGNVIDFIDTCCFCLYVIGGSLLIIGLLGIAGLI